MEVKEGKQQDKQPNESLILMLPILAMGVLIGIIALLMRSTGKW